VSFARDPGTLAYYERRAGEYDEWYEGEGRFAVRERPGWDQELQRVIAIVKALPAARTLDVACGTAFLSRHLRGFVVGLDASPAMVAIAQERLPNGLAVAGDALDLPFADHAFDRVLTGHFYGHLAAEDARGSSPRPAGWRPSWWWSTPPGGKGFRRRAGRSGSSTTAHATGSTSGTSPRGTCVTNWGPRSSMPGRGS
jgi:SAM-dependent methyltransferase